MTLIYGALVSNWHSAASLAKSRKHPYNQQIAKVSGGKGPRQKTSKIVKKCQKVFRHFSTIFAQGKQTQKSSKSVKKFFDTFRHFSRGTIFRPLLGGSDTKPLHGHQRTPFCCCSSGKVGGCGVRMPEVSWLVCSGSTLPFEISRNP